MKNKKSGSKKKIVRNTIIVTLATLVCAISALVAYAYFSTSIKLYTNDGQTEYFKMGMELNTFFDMIDSSNVETGTSLGIKCTDTSVCTSTNKLTYITDDDGVNYYTYNPSAEWGSASNPYIISKVNHLQNLYVLQNCGYFTSLTGNGTDETKLTEDCMPYFLVCDNTGKPVTINGENKTYEYIGNDKYPFIGYLGGAFTTSQTVDGETTTITTTVDGKSSSQSVIYNLVSITDSDIIDVGLFGRIGYLGDDASATNGVFSGSASTVSDLLLYNVQIKVESKSAWDSIVELIANHLFTYGSGSSASSSSVACENHHIGILAGHVDYATVENISVYYSSDSVTAINVKHTDVTSGTAANYYSVSGILGFCNEMNSEQANGQITIGGISNEDIEVSSGGVGTGGGLESGLGSGYVTAAEIYSSYHDSGEIVKCTIPVTENNPDGTTYTSYIYKYGLVILLDTENLLTYDEDSTTWCSLQDKVTPVNVHKPDDSDTYVATIYSSYENFFGTTQSSSQDWAEFVIYNVQEGKYYYYETGKDVLTQVTTVESTGISMRYAAKKVSVDNSEDFTRLCTQYERSRIGSTITGWTQTTDRCYFYDGVFTFALSDPTDTIEKTWDSATADTFYVGDVDESNWTTITTEGNKAVVSYIKQLTTVDQVKSAADAGKKVYIIYEVSNDDGSKSEYLVTLASDSTYTAGNGEDALYTYYTSLDFVDDEMSEQLKSTVASGTVSSPISGMTNAEVAANWSNYKILNLGSSTDSDMSLSKLSTYYNIDVGFTSATSSSDVTDEFGNLVSSLSNVTVTSGTGITESGLTHTWDGFIAFETNDASSRRGYNYWDGYIMYKDRYATLNIWYVTSSGKTLLGTTQDAVHTNPNYFKQPYELSDGVSFLKSEYGQSIYSYGDKIGPLLFLEGSLYYASWSRANDDDIFDGSNEVTLINGQYVTSYSTTNNYFLATISDNGTTYKLNGAGNDIAAPTIVEGKTITIAGNNYSVYTDGTHEGILLSTRSTSGYYTFSSTRDGVTYTLRMLRRAYSVSRYSILCASDTYATTASNFVNEWGTTPSLKNSTEATVALADSSTGTFYISYQINGNTRYLEYDSDGGYFHGTSSQNDACKMYIYTIEGSQDINYGRVTYQPSSSSEYSKSYSASDYVLWPNQIYDGTDEETSESTSAYKPSTSSNYTTDPTYTVKSLASLFGQTTSKWKNSSGERLDYDDLSSVFSLGDGISSINIVSLLGGESATNFNSEYIKAPIGTTGEESYIPTGCVAFRINESGTTNKIRVIVAVPSSEYYYGQSVGGTLMNPDEVDYSEDYYFCMWQIEAAGSSTTTEINLDNCKQAFEIPRSNPYKPGTTASSIGDYVYDENITGTGAASASSVKNYITITDGTGTYRSYLNGAVVLVAYEFTASDEGVYVLGSNHECQIVYFSADATASTGKDGTNNYRMGTIDFVYDYNDVVLTVDKPGSITTDDDGSTIYDFENYYYPTLCLLYTDNFANGTNGVVSGDSDVQIKENDTSSVTFPNINDFQIKVRRYLSGNTSAYGASQLIWTAYGGKSYNDIVVDAAYLQFVRYSYTADTITRNTDVNYNDSSTTN